MFVLWDKPKSIAGWYCGSKEQASRLFAIPRRVHRLRTNVNSLLFSGTIAINAKLTETVIGSWVEIIYKGETLTATGRRFKRFDITIKPKKRDGILNPDDEPVPSEVHE